MSEWFSAQKLAGLPGLPGTVQGINSRAIRDSWQQRKHMGRGGGREYHISSLPEETRAALLNAALGEVATKVVRQETQLALVET
ncbi:DNA-binding protein, partial [Pseudomonas aeruginosa]